VCVWRRAGDVGFRGRGGAAFRSPSSDFGGSFRGPPAGEEVPLGHLQVTLALHTMCCP
jgi:hypothetical protein